MKLPTQATNQLIYVHYICKELNDKDKAEHKPKEKERASVATSHSTFEDEAMNQQSSHKSNNVSCCKKINAFALSSQQYANFIFM